MSALISADASEAQAQVALAKAKADFDRASDLFEHNAVAKKDVQSAESALPRPRASLQQARAAASSRRGVCSLLGLNPATSSSTSSSGRHWQERCST